MSSQRVAAITPMSRTWQIFQYGGLSQLTLSQTYRTPPIMLPNQVLIKVKAVSVNPIDIEMSKGYGASLFNVVRTINGINEFPLTLGRDFSGTIIKTGRLVRTFVPGMDVMGALWPFEHGTHADYVVCCQSQIAKKPSLLSHIEAAAIPYAGLTAYSALVEFGCLKLGNGPKKKILILGSGGGVGTFALQIAKSFEAYVMVTCKEHSEEMLLKLGADGIFHNNSDSLSDVRFDIILDCIGGGDVESYASVLKRGPSSRLISLKHSFLTMTDKYSPLLGCAVAVVDFMKHLTSFALRNRAIYQWGFFRASGANLSVLSNMVDKNQLTPIIHRTFNFTDAREAFETLQSGSIKGKVIIELNDNG